MAEQPNESAARSALITVWHQMRWDLLRMRWWIAGAIALMATQLLLSRSTELDVAAVILGLLQLFYVVLLGIVAVQADSPLMPAAFFRGRPMRWWVMPVSKFVMLFAAISLPALLFGFASIAQFEEPWKERALHVMTIISSVGGVVLLAFTFGAFTSGVAELGVLLVANYLASMAAAKALQAISWPGAPWLVWISVPVMLWLTFDIYRRAWTKKAALAAVLSLNLVGAMTSTKKVESQSRGRTIPKTDSVRVVIDSVTTEQPHIVRIAFTTETKLDIDGIRFQWDFASVGDGSHVFGLTRLNHPSAVLVERPPSANDKLTVSDSLRTYWAELTKSHRGSTQGSPNRDLHFDKPDIAGVRRAQAVAIVAIWDTTPEIGTMVHVGGSSVAFRSRAEGRLPLVDRGAAVTGSSQWRLRSVLEDGQRTWKMQRVVLSPMSEDQQIDRALDFGGRYSTRLVEHGQLANTGVAISGSSSSLGLILVPGLARSVETFYVSPWRRTATSLDTVEVFKLDPVRALTFSARRALVANEGEIR